MVLFNFASAAMWSAISSACSTAWLERYWLPHSPEHKIVRYRWIHQLWDGQFKINWAVMESLVQKQMGKNVDTLAKLAILQLINPKPWKNSGRCDRVIVSCTNNRYSNGKKCQFVAYILSPIVSMRFVTSVAKKLYTYMQAMDIHKPLMPTKNSAFNLELVCGIWKTKECRLCSHISNISFLPFRIGKLRWQKISPNRTAWKWSRPAPNRSASVSCCKNTINFMHLLWNSIELLINFHVMLDDSREFDKKMGFALGTGVINHSIDIVEWSLITLYQSD